VTVRGWRQCSELLSAVSHISTVAQHASLKANAKVNGRGQISHSHPSKIPELTVSNISLRLPRNSMCKSWFESIHLLWICIHKKCLFMLIFCSHIFTGAIQYNTTQHNTAHHNETTQIYIEPKVTGHQLIGGTVLQ